MAIPPLLRLDHISLTFGGTPLLRDVNLSLEPGERIALVGRNGCGKSILLKIAGKLIEPGEGEIFHQPGTTLRYLPQLPDLQGFANVLDYVEAGLDPIDHPYRAAYLLDALELDGQAAPATLSGGQLRRAALARTLAPQPDILLLDEPTNHLDLPAIEWLENELAQSRSAMVIISHDRRFLETISRATVWLDRGISHKLTRSFAHFEAWRDEILAKEEREQHLLSRQIVREEHWLRYGVTARRKRNVRRLADLQDLRQKQRSHQAVLGVAKLESRSSSTQAKLIIEAQNISKSYSQTPIVENFSIRIHRGERVGIIGRNGAGKTTLLSMLTGKLAPDYGSVRLGVALAPSYLDQVRQLDEASTVETYLTDGRGDSLLVGGEERHVVAYMKDFLFLPEQKRTPIRELSGGERARLMLAKLLAKPSNLLILDEPTNDLDMETLDLLQELIASFVGTVLLISHDRDFLDRCATSIVAAEGAGKWQIFAGGYSDMLAQRRAQLVVPKAAKKSASSNKSNMVKSKSPQVAVVARPNELSFKQQHRLTILPQEMEKLATRLAILEEEIGQPQLYMQDAARFKSLSAELVHMQEKLAAYEEEWLELELLREKFEKSADL